MVDLPFTAKVIFPRIAKNSKIECEGGTHIPKRILSSVEDELFFESTCVLFYHQPLRGVSYVIRNVTFLRKCIVFK